ncbi:serine/threonine protein kinase [Nonomuraea sp. NBC_01738]|uniref:serine/threonine-protein kinase n=1 Tax=Nonomuraea sp. NBC_01738 TaxID=2976003 RepID=UPI002E0E71CC|nr:serine/threonine protein kinase [Nonomuraea sp. NBC_01738]
MEPTGAAPLRPTDPRAIGPYRLLGRLGEGGMGTVYLARAAGTRFVAVKVVKSEFANQEGFAVRFHGEVENARKVASFCTAQVLDNGNTDEGRPYMVTEYIAGTPLSEQISLYGALDPGPLHGVALGVAAALAAIHVAELVHRDLKPANVILSLSGPRVIDFGIARALDRESGFTLSGELLGSPGWWAPEQVRGEMVTPAADIFAWGCLVAYAGNGRHPFGRGDVITLATRVLHAPPDLGTLPPPLDELVRRATAMSPADRPSAQDLLLALVGGSAPSTAGNTLTAVNSPTLVTDELLSDWEPPQNVIDEPDLTTNFAGTPTPPPVLPEISGKIPTADAAPAAQSSTVIAPPTAVERDTNPPHTDPGTIVEPRRPLGTRWLIAAAAAILAMALTAGILIYQGSQTTTPPAQAPAAQAANRTTDVGRRYPLGKEFDGPQLVIPNAPECGLTDYQGAQPSKGRFCLIRWTLINPGGDLTLLGNPVVTLVDDRNARLDPLPSSTPLPAALPPGGRVDGVLVFDLAPARTPARLSATMFDGGKQIEVTL